MVGLPVSIVIFPINIIIIPNFFSECTNPFLIIKTKRGLSIMIFNFFIKYTFFKHFLNFHEPNERNFDYINNKIYSFKKRKIAH